MNRNWLVILPLLADLLSRVMILIQEELDPGKKDSIGE